MFGEVSPPTEGFNSFILYRAAYSDLVEIVIGEDSYCLHWLNCRNWLKSVIHDFFFMERMYDYLFNMRCCYCELYPRLLFKPFDSDLISDKLVTSFI